jgi:hypothetical protein
LGAGGRGFESRHPDQRCRSWGLLSTVVMALKIV